MKKIAFTVYVIGIIIMFPLYLILEINKGTKKTSNDHRHDDVIELVERKPSENLVKIKVENDSHLLEKLLPVTYDRIGHASFFVVAGSSL